MDLDLLAILLTRIPPDQRARAERCVEAKGIRILGATSARAEALILSDDAPVVRVSVDAQGDLLVWCTCGASQRTTPCEHLWALALAMKRMEFGLRAVPGHEPTPYFDPGSTDRDDEEADEDEDEDFVDEVDAVRAWLARHAPGRSPHASRQPAWQRRLTLIEEETLDHRPDAWASGRTAEGRILFGLDLPMSRMEGGAAFTAWSQKRLKSGEWGVARTLSPSSPRAHALATADDLDLLDLLVSRSRQGPVRRGWPHQDAPRSPSSEATTIRLIRRLCKTGRFYLDRGGDPVGEPLVLDDGPPWWMGLRLDEGASPDMLQVTGFLARKGERVGLEEPDVLFASGLLVLRGRVAAFDPRGAMSWVVDLRGRGPFNLPASDRGRVVASLLALPGAPILELEGDVVRAVRPRPHLQVDAPEPGGRRRALSCQIWFAYDGTWVHASEARGHILASATAPPIWRDLETEGEARAQFLESGGSPPPAGRIDAPATLPAARLPALVSTLLSKGWTVEAEGVRYRQAGAFRMSVRSGIDWFDLEGAMDFDGQVVGLPALLAAARRGSRMVKLGDGSQGLLPEKWLDGWEVASAVGSAEGEGLRFRGNQGWLLDALLAGQDEVDVDRRFEEMRGRLQAFRGIRPARQPRGVEGTLRAYQLEGLAWLRFLREMGLGGCLADDMGLGKTVQVLALLEGLRAGRKKRPPSLVVAPRSLIFNWMEEAGRFTPKLRVLDYTGPARKTRFDAFGAYDLILTTYGTLRRDITQLKDVAFDVVVLDESQAIKNARSQAAKAARLLRADHRLALSGTPIENHLGELWSLFEFLNPGMLGRAKAFQEFLGGADGRTLDAQARARLASSIRPFILRRTKEQVLPDLPARTDQILHCEMKPAQRREYDRIREHFRTALLGGEDSTPGGQTKLHVLEALLRLRQAACHLALLDPKRRDEPSAKLDALLPMLEEVAEGGHKALVFSQFTKFLAVVRKRLDRLKIPYEYLDGRTRDRKAKVDRFQEDPDCRAFLISLKAGGLGLNLTAADYVFILDPWWNPAVERQAVDRAHRIGQERPVMAYRLVCRDTVEEKVLALQAEKQELANALLAPESSILKTLTREDLELLLS